MADAPIALIVFNRPKVTRRSFEAIRRLRPERLFVIADGPRPDTPSDEARCAEVRDIVSDVDWPCDVHTDYAEVNMGLKARVSSGISKALSEADRLVILEDDCIPHADFFPFCNALLDRYADDERVLGITGSNFQDGRVRGDGSYYFSRFNPLWGWATWRRAWEPFDVDMGFWEAWVDSPEWYEAFPDPAERSYWRGEFSSARRGDVDSWGYPWMAHNLFVGGLTATPNVNLISNVGFGDESTHTTQSMRAAFLPTGPLGGLSHPSRVASDPEADRYMYDHRYGGIVRRRRSSVVGTAVWAAGGVGRRARREWRRLIGG
jgi:hypothetical protein